MSSKRFQSGSTRHRIFTAARDLLEKHDYAVGLEQIAHAAGVSRQALYLHFGSKAALLVALVEWVDEQENLAELFAPVFAADSGVEALERAVQASGTYAPRIHRLAMVLESARKTDEAAADAWNDRMSSRRGAFRIIVERIHAEGDLDPRWSVDEAIDLVWTAILPQTYDALVSESGWTTERWITATTQLLVGALTVRDQ